MKLLALALILGVFMTTVNALLPNIKKAIKFDIDTALKNDIVVNLFIKCLLDQAPCGPESRNIKKDLPEFIATKCEKCDENQKQAARKAIKFLMKERPESWEKILKKYDPDNKYADNLKEFLEEQ